MESLDGYPPRPLTIRLAGPGDAAAVATLAGRDSRPMPCAPLLLAERGDVVEAAISLSTGAVVADPFRPTSDLVELLRCHAAALHRGDEPRAGRRARRLARRGRPRFRLAGAGS